MLVITVVAVAYGSAAPQLSVAEFAPAARSQIAPPPTTAGDSGSNSSGRGRDNRQTTTTTAIPSTQADAADSSSSIPTTKVGRARPCFGEPPRQLPDPRSPACVAAIFEGENGGATSKGVSATEIRIAWPTYSDPVPEPDRTLTAAVFEYFNQHFELYGRRLVLVPVPYVSSNDVAAQRSLAAELGAKDVFAALQPPVGVWQPSWYQELARQKVITVTSTLWSMLSDREAFDPLHPYLWSVYPSLEQNWLNLSDFACTQLVGRPASHAGGQLRNQERLFGVLAAGTARVPATRSLTERLEACGAQTATAEWASQRDSATVLDTAIARLREAGATTFVCACADLVASGVGSAVSRSGWEPEWIFTGLTTPSTDEYSHQAYLSDQQRSHLFGLQALDRVGPLQAQWWWQTLAASGFQGADDGPRRFIQAAYEQLLVLAAGIQGAGPGLNPGSFGQALMATQFANVGAGAPPYWQGSVGFGPGDHSFMSDFAVVWWDNSATPYGPFSTPAKGSWCYLDGGARFRAGAFPAGIDGRLFSPSERCR